VRPVLLAVALGIALSGCALFTPGKGSQESGAPYPQGCAAYDLSARRCKAIVEWVIEQEKVRQQDVSSVDLLDPTPCPAGRMCKSTASLFVRVRLHLANGGVAERTIGCGVGCQYSILYTETPEISIGGPVLGGYRDVPCANENGEGCGTPLPTPDAAAVAGARPLRVAAFDVAIDHAGHYDVEIGRAVLPNGVVSKAWIELANKMTQAVTLTDSGIFVDVHSTTPGAPSFDNYYLRGWHPGPEEVAMTLRFDVKDFTPGAVLQIRNVVLE
jgi:hypothetical protein